MSGPLPKQQKSRSPKGEPTEDVISKEDAVKLAKAVDYEKVATTDFGSWIEPDDTTDQNGDGSSEEGDEDDGIDS